MGSPAPPVPAVGITADLLWDRPGGDQDGFGSPVGCQPGSIPRSWRGCFPAAASCRERIHGWSSFGEGTRRCIPPMSVGSQGLPGLFPHTACRCRRIRARLQATSRNERPGSKGILARRLSVTAPRQNERNAQNPSRMQTETRTQRCRAPSSVHHATAAAAFITRGRMMARHLFCSCLPLCAGEVVAHVRVARRDCPFLEGSARFRQPLVAVNHENRRSPVHRILSTPPRALKHNRS